MSRDQRNDSGCNMRVELNRLVTYGNWPARFIDPHILANAGFYYTGVEDKVCCAFCNIILNKWEEGDNPMADHRKWAPNCPFVRERDCTNDSNTRDSTQISEDICQRFAYQIMLNSVPEQENHRLPAVQNYGLYPGGPVYNEYTSRDQRLQSYHNWPIGNKLTPEQLATAGFFYVGDGDRTICFYCRGGLNNWEDGDDAWEEHAKWFPKCRFLLMNKGEQYVSEVRNKSGDVVLSKAEASSSVVPSDSKIKDEPKKDNNRDSDCNTCKMCKICYVREMEVAFIPCGHLVACIDCTSAFTVCPFCRERINSTLRIFQL